MPTNTTIRAAAVQMDIRIGENDANLQRVLELVREAAANGAQLIVFPECALSGYCFASAEEAAPFGEPESSYRFNEFDEQCRNLGVTGVLGFLRRIDEHERWAHEPNRLYNAALIANASNHQTNAQISIIYDKTHLPILGIDRFTAEGEWLGVCDTHFGRIGVLICYDIRFPEAARVLALQGADVIALPTNWPVGAESSPEFIVRTRAWENRVFIVAANRVGVERGRRFIGRSQIVAPSGKILCEAGGEEETILYADLDIAEARRKRITIEPGEWELDITAHRRPELYGPLTWKASDHESTMNPEED